MKIFNAKPQGTVLVAIAALLLTGCGNSSSSDTPAATQTTTQTATVQAVDCATVTPTATVSITGSSFNPAAASIAVNGVVKWTNNDGINHTVTSGTQGSADGIFDSGLATGSSVCLQFNNAGTYKYYCRIHTFMTGTVTVQ